MWFFFRQKLRDITIGAANVSIHLTDAANA
jgi:hypothetical protein